jgi:phosphotransferase system enzyme I (PtsI)
MTPTSRSGTSLHGVPVSTGRATGPVVRVAEPAGPPERSPAPADHESEARRIRPAAQAVADRLNQRATTVDGQARAVMETTAAMALDPELLSQAEKLVHDRSLPAPRAVFEAANGFAEVLAAAGEYLAERVRDVQDVRDRIVAELQGIQPPGPPELVEPAVVLARDLAPADTADLDPALVLALVTEEGGPTSHTAILARSLGIPAIVAVRGLLSHPALGAQVDGDTGEIVLTEEPLTAEAATRSVQEWDGAGRTADDHPVKVLANIGSAADAQAAVAARAQGVGLFRTEFCYLDASVEPDVADQRAAYAEVLAPLAGLPVVVRTLDAGADKPLPFLDAAAEPNPALGVRGLRIAFDRPDILDRQLTAIAAAAQDTGALVSVMAPMVATPQEASWFVEKARAAGIARAGVMIEIPAAALMAREILDAVDFASIGTNDLAQYTFAADRMTGALATLNDPWHPALLRLIAALGAAGQDAGKPVGVCGEAASDATLAGVLAGLGVSSLSMTANAIAQVGSALPQHTRETYRKAAQEVLAASSPDEARKTASALLK